MDRSEKVNAPSKPVKPVEYADIRVGPDGDVLIAVDACGLVEGKVASIKRKNGRIFILQQGRVRANFEVQIKDLYDRIAPGARIIIAQVDEDGDLQVIDQIDFK
jgi:hypothetical protein